MRTVLAISSVVTASMISITDSASTCAPSSSLNSGFRTWLSSSAWPTPGCPLTSSLAARYCCGSFNLICRSPLKESVEAKLTSGELASSCL